MEQLTYKIGTTRNPILIDIKEYNNLKLIDIRKYFIDKEDAQKLIPTKKGISLNGFQFQQLIEVLNSNSKSIAEFFELSDKRDINVKVQSTMGRSFQCKYENNKTTVIVDEKLSQKLNEENLLLFSKMIEAFNIAISDVLEQEDEMVLIMDVLNNRISRIL
jgi:hypothetical protein